MAIDWDRASSSLTRGWKSRHFEHRLRRSPGFYRLRCCRSAVGSALRSAAQVRTEHPSSGDEGDTNLLRSMARISRADCACNNEKLRPSNRLCLGSGDERPLANNHGDENMRASPARLALVRAIESQTLEVVSKTHTPRVSLVRHRSRNCIRVGFDREK